jgi:hypothetical protein
MAELGFRLPQTHIERASTVLVCATPAVPPPTAEAGRFLEPARTGIPGRLVSSGRRWRGICAKPATKGTAVTMKPFSSSTTQP